MSTVLTRLDQRGLLQTFLSTEHKYGRLKKCACLPVRASLCVVCVCVCVCVWVVACVLTGNFLSVYQMDNFLTFLKMTSGLAVLGNRVMVSATSP